MKIRTLVAMGGTMAGALWGGPGVAAETETWPRFRGPAGNGTSPSEVPVELGKETLAWSVPLPGSGTSSPALWGGKLFVTGEDREKGEVTLACLDTATGRMLWANILPAGNYRTHKMNNTAAASPAVAEGVVVQTWYDSGKARAVLSAFDHDGKGLWTYEIGDFKGSHGLNLQPVIHEGRVLVVHLHQKGGYVCALDAADGKPVWRKDYPEASPKTTYITPLVRKRSDGREEVVVAATSIGVRGIDLASGEVLWQLPGVFKERCIVSPVNILSGSGSEGALVTVGCKNNVFFAVRPPEARGGQPEIAWRLPKHAPYVPTPVSDGRTLYVLSDGGVLSALDARTGKQRWQEKLPANFYASPLLLGGKLYCLSREGECFVAEVGESFKLLATSDLEPGGEVTWTDATPAAAGGSLYLRVGARMDCYRKAK